MTSQIFKPTVFTGTAAVALRTWNLVRQWLIFWALGQASDKILRSLSAKQSFFSHHKQAILHWNFQTRILACVCGMYWFKFWKKLQFRIFHKIDCCTYFITYMANYTAIFDAPLHPLLLNFSILRALYIVLRVCFSLNCQFCLIWLSGEKISVYCKKWKVVASDWSSHSAN